MEHVREVMASYRLTTTQLSERTGYERSALHRNLKGLNAPDFRKAIAIAVVLSRLDNNTWEYHLAMMAGSTQPKKIDRSLIPRGFCRD